MLHLLLGAALAAPPATPDAAARAAFLASAHPAREGRPPNLVLIVADDLGVMDVGAYGGAIPTPNLDALGATGVVFEDASVTSPICAPSRAGLLTGRYPQRQGFELLPHPINTPGVIKRTWGRLFLAGDGWELTERQPRASAAAMDAQGLAQAEILLPELLSRRGYATGMTGKWHLGTRPDQLPNARGFDSFYGVYEAHTLYAERGREDLVELELDHFADRRQWRVGRRGDCAIRRDGAVIDEPRYLTTAIAEEASAFIAAHAGEPFFLYVPFTAPHAPFQAPRDAYEALGHIADPDQRVYAALVSSLDAAVGQVVAALEASGLRDDTLIVFTSDNGAAAYTHVVSNAPLAGGKLSHLQGGVRVPMIASWPGQLPAGLRYAPPVSALDVLPTFAEASQTELPTDRPYDGVSLLPYLRDGLAEAPHPWLFWRTGASAAVRQGSTKLIVDGTTGDRALYDLAADPGEWRDLSDQQPARAAELEAALRAWEAELLPSPVPPIMQYRVEHAGQQWVFPL